MELNLACWNCRGIMSGVPYLIDFLNTNRIDVIAIAEHWLRSCQLMFLDTIDPTNYIGYGKGADDNCHQLFNFNIRGGVAFLVSKSLQPFVEVLDIPSNRISGIELNIPDTPNIYLISVYLPAVTQSYELFSKEVEILIDVYNIYSTMGTVVLMGDFNCKIEGPRYTFDYDKRSDSFRSFMQECNLRSLHLETNGIGPVCTFQSYQGGPKTAIDYIIVSIENLTKCLKIQVPGCTYV